MFFTLTDVCFLIIILVFAVIATAKGFINAIFGKLCWILGLIFAFLFYKKLTGYMKQLVHNETVSSILCFVLIFVIVFLIVKIIQTLLSRAFDGEIMKGLDRSLGFFFGLLEGCLVVFVFVFLLTNQPWFDVSKIFEGSFFVKMLQPLLNYTSTNITIPPVGEVV